MYFKSKVYPAWSVVLWAAVLIGSVLAWTANSYLPRFLPGIKFLLAISNFISLETLVFLVWARFGTDYAIRGDALIIRCGCFRWQVEIDEITAIGRVTDDSLAPALSPDRLQIRTAEYSILISPRNKEVFVENLLKINTNILCM